MVHGCTVPKLRCDSSGPRGQSERSRRENPWGELTPPPEWGQKWPHVTSNPPLPTSGAAGASATAEQVRQQPVNRWSLDALRSMDQGELLGIREGLKAEDLNRVRRRFASALHPDRVQGLPDWTEALFSEIMRIVNKACDRQK